MSSLFSLRHVVACTSLLASMIGSSGCAADLGADEEDADEALARTEDALDVSPSATEWSSNQLINGSFETNDGFWGLEGSWLNDCARAFRVRALTDAKQGNFVMTLASSGFSAASASQLVPAAGGRTYRLRAWSRAWVPGDASKVLLRMEFLTLDRKLLGSATEIAASRTADWQLNSVKAQAPSGTRFVRVTALAKKRTDGGCMDIGFDPTVALDAVKLQYAK